MWLCHKTNLLVTGWDSVALVDLRVGHLSGEHSLPCQPLSEPVIGDVNGDGFNDFIIVCRDGSVDGFLFIVMCTHSYYITNPWKLWSWRACAEPCSSSVLQSCHVCWEEPVINNSVSCVIRLLFVVSWLTNNNLTGYRFTNCFWYWLL